MNNALGLGIVGLIVFGMVFVLLCLLVPFSAYAAQKWAHRTYREVEKMNTKLEEIVILARTNTAPKSHP